MSLKSRKNSSLVELVKGRWREFKREPSALFFVVFMPILWMTVLGFAFSNSAPERYGVGWSGSAALAPATATLKDLLSKSPQVRLKAGDDAELTQWLKRGDILVVVKPAPSGATIMYDSKNRDSQHARAVVADLVQRAAGRVDPVIVKDEQITIIGSRYIDFLVPGLIAFSIMTSSLFGTGNTIVSNRRENLLKRYLATPMRASEYIVSHIIGRSFILVVELSTILIAATLIFHFKIAGNLGALIAFAALGAAAFTALSIFCGSRTSNSAVMSGMTNLISLPMMMLSGVWFSRASFPEWMAEPVRYLPLTPLVDGLRKIALEGATLMNLQFEITVLAVYVVVCTFAAKTIFKWY